MSAGGKDILTWLCGLSKPRDYITMVIRSLYTLVSLKECDILKIFVFFVYLYSRLVLIVIAGFRYCRIFYMYFHINSLKISGSYNFVL